LHFACRSQCQAQLLTGFSHDTKTRGRPSELHDSELFSIRDRYVQTLENEWGDIRWDLSRAKSLADVRLALASVNSQYCLYYRADCFSREPSKGVVEADGLRQLRRRLQETTNKHRLALEDERSCRDRVERLTGALDSAHHQSKPNLFVPNRLVARSFSILRRKRSIQYAN